MFTSPVVNIFLAMSIFLQGLLPMFLNIGKEMSTDGSRFTRVGGVSSLNSASYSSLSPAVQSALGTESYYNDLTDTQKDNAVHFATNYVALSPYISWSSSSESGTISITRSQALSLGIAGDVYDMTEWALEPEEENSAPLFSSTTTELDGTYTQYCANKRKLLRRVLQLLIGASTVSLTAAAICAQISGPTPLQAACAFLGIIGALGAGAAGILALIEEADPSEQVCVNL